MMKNIIWTFSILFFISCQAHEPKESEERAVEEHLPVKSDFDNESWGEITESSGIKLDLRYSTKNNFTKKQIYNCPRCFLRPEAAKKLKQIQKDIKERYNLGLIIYDCYRPRPAQQKLWDIVPNPNYVTNPKKGSMHNRGLAVDVGLVDKEGRVIDMGTDFDYFGKEAHHDFYGLDKKVLKYRGFLKKLMDLHGFKSIRTEWWHYSLRDVSAPISDWEWSCDS